MGGGSKITLNIMECNPREWIVGLNFFDSYYVIFDDEEARIGITVSEHASDRHI